MEISKGMILKHRHINMFVRVGYKINSDKILHRLEEVSLYTDGWGRTYYTGIFCNNNFMADEEKIRKLYTPLPNSITFIGSLND